MCYCRRSPPDRGGDPQRCSRLRVPSTGSVPRATCGTVHFSGGTMIVARIYEGLGNQLFQYAMGRAVAARHGVPLRLDLDWFDSDQGGLGRGSPRRAFTLHETFHATAERATRRQLAFHRHEPTRRGRLLSKVMRLGSSRLARQLAERGRHFQPACLDVGPDAYLDGYWQSSRYFDPIAVDLRAEFRLRPSPAVDHARAQLSRWRLGGRRPARVGPRPPGRPGPGRRRRRPPPEPRAADVGRLRRRRPPPVPGRRPVRRRRRPGRPRLVPPPRDRPRRAPLRRPGHDGRLRRPVRVRPPRDRQQHLQLVGRLVEPRPGQAGGRPEPVVLAGRAGLGDGRRPDGRRLDRAAFGTRLRGGGLRRPAGELPVSLPAG